MGESCWWCPPVAFVVAGGIWWCTELCAWWCGTVVDGWAARFVGCFFAPEADESQHKCPIPRSTQVLHGRSSLHFLWLDLQLVHATPCSIFFLWYREESVWRSPTNEVNFGPKTKNLAEFSNIKYKRTLTIRFFFCPGIKLPW